MATTWPVTVAEAERMVKANSGSFGAVYGLVDVTSKYKCCIKHGLSWRLRGSQLLVARNLHPECLNSLINIA